MRPIRLSSNLLIRKHLKLIRFFLDGNPLEESLSVKVGFSLTCLYMWFIQTFYCFGIGLGNTSLVCGTAALLYLLLMFLLKARRLGNMGFSRWIVFISILNLNLCYLDAGAGINPTIVWFMAIPVVSIILTGLFEGMLWSLFASFLSIFLMEVTRQMAWETNSWSMEQMYDVGQSNLFTGPLLFYLMFGFFYFSRDKMQEKIQKQAMQIEEVALEKEKLLNVIFHDLGRNTALLSGYLELTEHEPLTKEDRAKLFRYAEEIKGVLKNAKNLDTHRISEEVKEIRLKEIFRALKCIYEKRLQSKGLGFHYIGDSESKVFARVSHLQSHILSNLVSNAIKFSHADGDIFFEANDKSISIKNTGIVFSEAQKRGTRNEEGSGIGLEIVRDYCLRNDYRLAHTSKEEETTATVYLNG